MPDLISVTAKTRPFIATREIIEVPQGLTIAEIVASILPDPVYRMHAVVLLNDSREPIEKSWWPRIKPRLNTRITISVVPHGGGFARIGAMAGVLAIAVAVGIFTGPIGFGLAFTLGMTLVNVFLPPPIPELSKNKGAETPSYSISGSRNRENTWGKVPFLLGKFRVVPPYGAQPYREIVSGEVYWRALFVIGHGPIDIQQMFIGETPLANFQGVETEFRRGYWTLTNKGSWSAATGAFPTNPQFADTWTVSVSGSVSGIPYTSGQTITFNGLAAATTTAAWDVDQGKPFALFPSDVFEESLNVRLSAGVNQVRTTQNGADEIAIEAISERGQYHVQNSPPGKKGPTTARFLVEQSPAGQNLWATVIHDQFDRMQSTPSYWGYRWKTKDYGTQDANKQYDIRITNTWGDQNDESSFGNYTWIALRTITMANPVPVSRACILAMRIKASGQLNGTIDEFNVIAQTIARDWDKNSQTWTWRPTSSPAALCRHVLQYPSRRKPASDFQINIPRLQYWDDITRPNHREFNGVIEDKADLDDILTRISRVGMAFPSYPNLKFTPVIDEPKTAPIRMFTPRNSWDYSGELSYEPIPHAFRIGYANRDKNYSVDETIAYADGYDSSNSTNIERVEIIGIDNHDQAWEQGRIHLADRIERREVHQISTDFEFLACERGDLVALQHDVISVGIGTGSRVSSVINDGITASGVILDYPIEVPSEITEQLGMRVRRVSSGQQRTDLYPVVKVDNRTFNFTSPVPMATAPQADNLVALGVLNRETLRVILKDIEPRADLTARLTFISEGPGVHTATSGTIPPYDPVITRPRGLPDPVVTLVRSDATVMQVTAGRELVARVLFELAPVTIDGISLTVLFRPSQTTSAWQEAIIQQRNATSVLISGVESGQSYDFRLIYTHPQYFSSRVTEITGHTVIGRSAPPAGLQGVNIAVVGGQALLRWDLPADLDVQIGGWILWRHDPSLTSGTWGTSTSIGRAVNGDQTHVYLPLKPGTYLARVYDADGRESAETASISTVQASVLLFSPVNELTEDPNFTGAKQNVELISGSLQLTEGSFDAVSSVDALSSWDSAGQSVAASGKYTFSAGLDFGSVRRIRLTSHIKTTAINRFDLIDAWADIDSRTDFDGTAGAPVDASVWGKLTNDNPASNPTWGAFMRIDSAEINARAVGQLECRMITYDRSFNIQVNELRLKAEEVL